MDWDLGVSRHKLLLIEWINKILLYTQGTIFNTLINYNGKEYEKECVCVCT